MVKEYRNNNYPKYDNDPEIIGGITKLSIKSYEDCLKVTYLGTEHIYKMISDNQYQFYDKESDSINREYILNFIDNTKLKFSNILYQNYNKLTWTYDGTRNLTFTI